MQNNEGRFRTPPPEESRLAAKMAAAQAVLEKAELASVAAATPVSRAQSASEIETAQRDLASYRNSCPPDKHMELENLLMRLRSAAYRILR